MILCNTLSILLPLLLGWIADKLLGDPPILPHPIVGFGKLIFSGEKKLNKGMKRIFKGAVFSIVLILSSFFLMYFIIKGLNQINSWLNIAFSTVIVFYCLAGKTLIDEVRQVFIAVDSSIDAGRKQVARIVGRNTSTLSAQQVRIAALETASENLSDGVVAPLFWLMLFGVPGMFAYKMVNTLDSMIGYKNERYKQFGCWAARIDDVANYIPARLTAVFMLLVSGHFSAFPFVWKYRKCHASPNSGYPEAALAGILNCRFGGSNIYFGEVINKPYIGKNDKVLTTSDMRIAIAINRRVEFTMIIFVAIGTILIQLIQR